VTRSVAFRLMVFAMLTLAGDACGHAARSDVGACRAARAISTAFSIAVPTCHSGEVPDSASLGPTVYVCDAPVGGVSFRCYEKPHEYVRADWLGRKLRPNRANVYRCYLPLDMWENFGTGQWACVAEVGGMFRMIAPPHDGGIDDPQPCRPSPGTG